MMEVCQTPTSLHQALASPCQTSTSTTNQDQQGPASTTNLVQKAPNQAPPAWYGHRAEHPLIAGIASAIHTHLSIHADCSRIKNFSANLEKTEPELQYVLPIRSKSAEKKR